MIFEPRELSVKVRKVSEVGEETLTFENVSYLNGTLGGRIIGWIDFEWTKKSYRKLYVRRGKRRNRGRRRKRRKRRRMR